VYKTRIDDGESILDVAREKDDLDLVHLIILDQVQRICIDSSHHVVGQTAARALAPETAVCHSTHLCTYSVHCIYLYYLLVYVLKCLHDCIRLLFNVIEASGRTCNSKLKSSSRVNALLLKLSGYGEMTEKV